MREAIIYKWKIDLLSVTPNWPGKDVSTYDFSNGQIEFKNLEYFLTPMFFLIQHLLILKFKMRSINLKYTVLMLSGKLQFFQ